MYNTSSFPLSSIFYLLSQFLLFLCALEYMYSIVPPLKMVYPYAPLIRIKSIASLTKFTYLFQLFLYLMHAFFYQQKQNISG